MAVNVLVSTKDMERNQWLEWRKKGIGGSDVAAIAGLNKYKSPVGVWLEKTGRSQRTMLVKQRTGDQYWRCSSKRVLRANRIEGYEEKCDSSTS